MNDDKVDLPPFREWSVPAVRLLQGVVQTVAVKDIQSLNRFIRDHMLEAHDWREKVQRLLAHFNELSTAHRELVRARRQQELLEPVEKIGKRYQQRAKSLVATDHQLVASDAYFKQATVRLYEPELERFQQRLAAATTTKLRLKAELDELQIQRGRLQSEIDQAGGDRLREIPHLIKLEDAAFAAKHEKRSQLERRLVECGSQTTIDSTEALAEVIQWLRQQIDAATKAIDALGERREQFVIERDAARRELREETEELENLMKRRSNLPGHLAMLRTRMCEDLAVSESDSPFAAELLAVRAEHREWEASAEMVLRSFALCLLVSDRLYHRVSQYVEQTRLVDQHGRGSRLVYLRVGRFVGEADSGDRLQLRSLVHKLEYRTGHDLTPWIRDQVARRFDYQCCETIEEFRDATRLAMTANRHVKVGDDRHEKLESEDLDIDGLLAVTQYFLSHPQPDCFARELPVPVDTKFIERNETILRTWLDILLPPAAIDVNEKKFARRFGLRDGELHYLVRLLDSSLGGEIGLPFDELSLPLRHLSSLPVADVTVIIVENKVNLLTLPHRERTVAMGGVGNGVIQLAKLPWLASSPILYRGDIDVDGFRILSTLRNRFSQVASMFMSLDILERFSEFIVPYRSPSHNSPVNLTEAEQQAFDRCLAEGLRLEQEHLPSEFVNAAMQRR